MDKQQRDDDERNSCGS